jgi:hypothetical protein
MRFPHRSIPIGAGIGFALALLCPPSVGAELVIAGDVTTADSNTTRPGRPGVAFDGTRYLVVSCRDFTAPKGIFGVFVSLGGKAGSPFPIASASCQTRPAVAFGGGVYLVAFSVGGRMKGARISRTGVVLDSSAFVIGPGATDAAIAFDGENYLVVWDRFVPSPPDPSGGYDVFGVRVTASGQVLDSAPLTIYAAAGEQAFPAVAFDGVNYLVVWRDNTTASGPGPTDILGSRITRAGVNLDPSGLRISTAAQGQGEPDVVFAAGNYLVAWTDGRNGSSDIYAARMSPDGVVLDGPADTGAIAVATRPGTSKLNPRVAFDGLSYVVVWQVEGYSLQGGTRGARVSTQGVLLDGPSEREGLLIAAPTCYACRSVYPSIRSDGSGRSLVAWLHNAEVSGATKSVRGALVTPTLAGGIPTGTELRINSYTTQDQHRPAIAVDSAGNFVVVWDSYSEDGSREGVFGQRYDAWGGRSGDEFRVNSFTTGSQGDAALSSDPIGNFVVAWASYGQDDLASGIFARRYDPSGTPQGGEFQVSSGVATDQRFPAIASDATGNFVVVWQSDVQDGSGPGVFGQRYDAEGSRVGAEFRVNSYTTGAQAHPSVAAAGDGSFIVVWQSDRIEGIGLGQGVCARRYDPSGAPLGPEFQVNVYITGDQQVPKVASDAGGNFVVVWTSADQDGSGSGVFGRRFAASGTPEGDEFLVNAYTTGHQQDPKVASDASGDFVVVWTSLNQDGSGSGVFGHRYDASGESQGGEFPVNSSTVGSQASPAVALASAGGFVVAWDSAYVDGSGAAVVGQRFLADLIFDDGFDSGDLARWSTASTDGADLSVSGAAAMGGTTSGLQAVVNDTHSLFVEDDTPSSESRYRARFYVDPNGFDPGEGSFHFRTRILIARDSSGRRVVVVVLKRQAGTYWIEVRVRGNDGTRIDTGFFPIGDGPNLVEFDWRRSTAPGASDGALQLWINGDSAAMLAGIDDDLSAVDSVRLGALSLKAGASGTLFFDQFGSRRQTLMGAE